MLGKMATRIKLLKRDDRRYAAVFEKEDPKLRYLPLAVQQKQIIVTCNYEARRLGLYKLQRVAEARKRCPEAIIMLGEDLSRFRNASKENYHFLRKFAWSGKVERLGFDEVFIDVTDMVDYNFDMINPNALHSSFFHLSRQDPTVGFEFDGRKVSGYTAPRSVDPPRPRGLSSETTVDDEHSTLYIRLLVGSHLAQYLRHQLEEHQGYSSTVGISTSKLMSKLVGNVNKPKAQTTLLPPYSSVGASESNVTQFLDNHDIGKIPGIGFKSTQKLRDYVRGRRAAFDAGLVYGGTNENVTVKDVRLCASMGFDQLERLLGGPRVPRGLGLKVWGLVHGVDHSEVSKAKELPRQISIEDSYIKLDTMTAVDKELRMLSRSLLLRIRADLLCVDSDSGAPGEEAGREDGRRDSLPTRLWLAYPRTLRLTTRPRPPLSPDGTRSRTFHRISRSCDMPSLVLNLSSSIEELSERLVQGTLIPLFHKLYPEKSGWNLSLINLCATNISLTAANVQDGAGRNISKMFRRQENVLKNWKIEDGTNAATINAGLRVLDKRNLEAMDTADPEPDACTECVADGNGAIDPQNMLDRSGEDDDIWQSDEDTSQIEHICTTCGFPVPLFATAAHDRFHNLAD
ncbi:MAG: hypothetical protein Q9196_000462 [Gyalolechia fulgens]